MFDLNADPGETTDLAPQHPDLLKEFDAIVKNEHRDPQVKQWQFVEEVIRQAGE